MSLEKLFVDDDDDDSEGDIDAVGDIMEETVSGNKEDCCSSIALALLNTLAMCACSSWFKWLRSRSAGDTDGCGIKIVLLLELRTLSIDTGLDIYTADDIEFLESCCSLKGIVE